MRHMPIMVSEITQHLVTPEIRSVFDGTVGLGGHMHEIMTQCPFIERYIGVDRDPEHAHEASKKHQQWPEQCVIVCDSYAAVGDIMHQFLPPAPTAFLLDIGVCSHHFDNPEKGFSCDQDAPLDMRFDPSKGQSVSDFLLAAKEEQIADILHMYGEERRARPLARVINARAKHRSLQSTKDLREVIESHTRPEDRKKTVVRAFQAFRIYINDELGHLESFLQALPGVLQSGDRVGIITFHSLEDRLVKQYFNRYSKPKTEPTEHSLHAVIEPALGRCLTKKPITPTMTEKTKNPRARSAKLRIYCHN